ncbi:helix-turn-helix domain-containing protein [Streptomyces sp. 4N509B]|uniref:helix-turn-helix domain-containing protein n=1 Tax=Streptomyces sp. 4N509B TaxID=3457413 RepID=UPI003FD47F73
MHFSATDATSERSRAERRITQKQLGRAAGYSESYVSRVEAGEYAPTAKFAQGCDRAFGTGRLFADLLARIDEADHPSWFLPYVELERKASRILDYSTTSIMGMLQTEDYARSIYRARYPHERADVIKGKVDARLRRREVMERKSPPMLWVILHEACLRTVVGGRRVMAGQLAHLVKQADSPNIDLQVMPFAAGAAAAHLLPYTLLMFETSPTVVYSDGPQGGRLHEKTATVVDGLNNYDRLRANALPPDDSVVLITTLCEEYTS